MAKAQYVEGVGNVVVDSRGNTSHSTQIRVSILSQGKAPAGASFAVLLDEDMQPRLRRIPAGYAEGPADLQLCARLAQEFLDEDVSARFFLMLGRIEMDLQGLRAEREAAGRASRPLSSITPRIEQLERSRSMLRKWSDAPDKKLPMHVGPSCRASFGFSPQPMGSPGEALRAGGIQAFHCDAALSGVSSLAKAFHGEGRNVIGVSFRDDTTGGGRMGLYDGLTRTDARFAPWVYSAGALPRLIEEGGITDHDLVIVETTVPVVAQIQALLRRMEAMDVNPTVLAIETSAIHLGKASELLAAYERQPTDEFFLDEVERRLSSDTDQPLGAFVEAVEVVAGRCGMNVSDAFELFRRERGHAYGVHLVEHSGPGL